MAKPLSRLSQQEATEAISSTRKTVEALQVAQRAVQALYLGDALDDERPARALEQIAKAATALLSLEIELRGRYGSGEHPSSSPMAAAPPIPRDDHRKGTKAPHR
jgi:hypothetical protein